jgi:hypothetical protein
MATIREVEALVADWEVRNSLTTNSQCQSQPVVKAWLLDFVGCNLTILIGDSDVTYLTAPTLDKSK